MTDAIVARNTDHSAIQSGEVVFQVAELNRFRGAARRIIPHVKKHHERLAMVIGQLGDGHIRVGQFEFRRSVALVQHVFHSSRYIESII